MPPSLTAAEPSRQEAIDALHERILSCQACVTAGHIETARPVRHPWSPRQRTMIVGQAPGLQTERKRYHFAGPGGTLLTKWLVSAGYDPDRWREQCYITSLTRCFPGKALRGRGDRKPGPVELALCQPFLEAELELVRPVVVLAVGGMAIEYFLGKHPLDRVVGTLVEQDSRLILPLPHPSGVSRWLNDPTHQGLVQQALRLLAELRKERGL